MNRTRTNCRSATIFLPVLNGFTEDVAVRTPWAPIRRVPGVEAGLDRQWGQDEKGGIIFPWPSLNHPLVTGGEEIPSVQSGTSRVRKLCQRARIRYAGDDIHTRAKVIKKRLSKTLNGLSKSGSVFVEACAGPILG